MNQKNDLPWMNKKNDVCWMNMFQVIRTRQLGFSRLDDASGLRFDHGVYDAVSISNEELLFVGRAISRSDATIFNHVVLKRAEKRSDKSPDFSGEFTKPEEFEGHKPDKFKVAAWWKSIQNGANAGAPYLRVALTPVTN